MNCSKDYAWKHATQTTPLPTAEVTHTAVFDDEEPGHVFLYQTDSTRFSPCRSVDTANRKHFRSVLRAWGKQHPLLDLRNDRTISLPGAARQPAACCDRSNNDHESGFPVVESVLQKTALGGL